MKMEGREDGSACSDGSVAETKMEAREDGSARSVQSVRICGAVLAAALVLALITGIIRGFAGSSALFLHEMERFAPPEKTGLPEAEYPGMAAHIADYLAGRKDSFQYEVNLPDIGPRACFHDHELAHMADCRGLIRLDGIVCAVSLILAALAAGLLIRRRKEGFREAFRGAKKALLALSAAAAGFLLWAAVSFDGLFLTFHRVAFTNDLWLLNPRTDLLIRLMPEEMFVDLGLKGLGVFAAGLAVLLTAGWLIRRRCGAG